MGLSGNKEPRELRELLDAMHLSTLADIEQIRGEACRGAVASRLGAQFR
jgi:hypothetical protein